jgi:hypothetical protein
MSQRSIRSRKFKLLLLKYHRNAGGEPGVDRSRGSSDQEYRVSAVERGNRREDIVDREIAVSRKLAEDVTSTASTDAKEAPAMPIFLRKERRPTASVSRSSIALPLDARIWVSDNTE